MQISATTPLLPITPVERTVTSPQNQNQAQTQAQTKTHDTSVKVKAVDQVATAPKVFTPAPPLRPNVQDYVDIDRTLIALRQGV